MSVSEKKQPLFSNSVLFLWSASYSFFLYVFGDIIHEEESQCELLMWAFLFSYFSALVPALILLRRLDKHFQNSKLSRPDSSLHSSLGSEPAAATATEAPEECFVDEVDKRFATKTVWGHFSGRLRTVNDYGHFEWGSARTEQHNYTPPPFRRAGGTWRSSYQIHVAQRSPDEHEDTPAPKGPYDNFTPAAAEAPPTPHDSLDPSVPAPTQLDIIVSEQENFIAPEGPPTTPPVMMPDLTVYLSVPPAPVMMPDLTVYLPVPPTPVEPVEYPPHLWRPTSFSPELRLRPNRLVRRTPQLPNALPIVKCVKQSRGQAKRLHQQMKLPQQTDQHRAADRLSRMLKVARRMAPRRSIRRRISEAKASVVAEAPPLLIAMEDAGLPVEPLAVVAPQAAIAEAPQAWAPPVLSEGRPEKRRRSEEEEGEEARDEKRKRSEEKKSEEREEARKAKRKRSEEEKGEKRDEAREEKRKRSGEEEVEKREEVREEKRKRSGEEEYDKGEERREEKRKRSGEEDDEKREQARDENRGQEEGSRPAKFRKSDDGEHNDPHRQIQGGDGSSKASTYPLAMPRAGTVASPYPRRARAPPNPLNTLDVSARIAGLEGVAQEIENVTLIPDAFDASAPAAVRKKVGSCSVALAHVRQAKELNLLDIDDERVFWKVNLTRNDFFQAMRAVYTPTRALLGYVKGEARIVGAKHPSFEDIRKNASWVEEKLREYIDPKDVYEEEVLPLDEW